jgi:adenylyltransferase/sulfurtransferase
MPPLIASIECTLAYQILTGQFDVRNETSYMVHIDGWRNTFDRVAVVRRQDCPCCVQGQMDFLDAVFREMITSLCGRDAIQIIPSSPLEITLEDIEIRLSRLGKVRLHPYMLTFRSGTEEISIFRDGRAIIKGTKDEAAARSLYARYIGL